MNRVQSYRPWAATVSLSTPGSSSSLRHWGPAGLFLLLSLVLVTSSAWSQEPIAAGLDLLETDPGDTFCDLSDLDLLCPGCFVVGDPLIPLDGVPLGQSPACGSADLRETDTIIRRLFDTPPLFPGEQAEVPIQIVELSLESVQPFQVNCQGENQLWMVSVGLDPEDPQQGQLQVNKTHNNGGFFTGGARVKPVFVFTRVDEDPPLNICEAFPPPQNFQLDGPWVHETNQFPLLEIPGCTSNFVPGIDGENGEEAFGVVAQSQNDHILWFPTTVETSSTPGTVAGAGLQLLRPASPNPFTDWTSLRYRIDVSGPVRLEIYNVRGQAIRTLVDFALDAGEYRVEWNGRDRWGHRVSSGVYTYVIRTLGGRDLRTFTLLR